MFVVPSMERPSCLTDVPHVAVRACRVSGGICVLYSVGNEVGEMVFHFEGYFEISMSKELCNIIQKNQPLQTTNQLALI